MLFKAIFGLLLAVSYAAQTSLTIEVMEDQIERLIAMGERKQIAAIRKLEADINPAIVKFREEEKKWKKMPKEHASTMAQTWRIEWENNISPKMDQLILTSMVCEEMQSDNPDCETIFSWNDSFETREQQRSKEFQAEFAWYVKEIISEIKDDINKGKRRDL